jgi:hypothetical protein
MARADVRIYCKAHMIGHIILPHIHDVVCDILQKSREIAAIIKSLKQQ